MFSLGKGVSFFKDQLSLQSAELYSKDLQALSFFVINVPIKGSSLRDYNEIGFNKVQKMFRQAIKQHGIKVINPFRTFLLRVLDQNFGYTDLHTLFMSVCNRFQIPKQALCILQRSALFRYISKNKMSQFLIQGCDIYIKLGQYVNAYQLIERGKNLSFLNIQNTLKLYSRIVVLYIYMGLIVPSDITETIKDQQKILELKSDYFKSNLAEQPLLQFYFKIQFYATLKTYRQLDERQKNILRKQGLLQIYQNSKWTSLKKYINQDIKKNNWRIKTQSIKDRNVADLSVITGINRNKQVYRYDCKDKIMYFNHKESTQEKLNTLITLAMNMSEEASSCRIERKEHDTLGIRGPKMGSFGPFGFGGRKQTEFFRRLG